MLCPRQEGKAESGINYQQQMYEFANQTTMQVQSQLDGEWRMEKDIPHN
jgi:hypothetical protein